MLTLEKAKLNLRIDDDDMYFDSLIDDLILASQADIIASTGVPPYFCFNIDKEEDIKNIDSLYTMCQTIIVKDMFEEREGINKSLISFETKLELEYRRVKKHEDI